MSVRADEILPSRGDFAGATSNNRPSSLQNAIEWSEPRVPLATQPRVPELAAEVDTEVAGDKVNSDAPSVGPAKELYISKSSTPSISKKNVVGTWLLWKFVKSRDINSLRSALNESEWPHYKLLKDSLLSQLLRLFIKNGEISEIKALFKDLSSLNANLYVRDDVVLEFLERVVREEGASHASQFAVECRQMFIAKPPVERRGFQQTAAAERLFQAAFSVNKVKYIDVFGLFDTVYELGYIQDAKPYLVEALKFKIKHEGFNETLLSFKLQLKHDRTTVGIHVLFEEAIRHWSKSRVSFENRLRTLIKLASTLDGPFDIFGELIVSLVVEGRYQEATVLFKKLSIPGNHFCRPLARLSRDEKYLPVVEKFSELVDSCIIAERKRGSKSTVTPEEQQGTEEAAASVAFLLESWTSTKKKKRPFQKPKRYKVNDEQLDKLNNTLIRVWLDLAEKSGNIKSGQQLKTWIETNDISLTERRVAKDCGHFSMRVLDGRRFFCYCIGDCATIPSDTCRLEWQFYVEPRVLNRIMELVESNPSESAALLSDRRFAQLVTAFGSKCSLMEGRLRDELLSEFIQRLQKSGFKFGVLSHNAILNSRLENGSNVDVLAYLDKLDAEGVDANAETFSLFTEVYAQKGDINGVKSVIGLMKDSGMPVTEKALQSMVYALTMKGERVQAVEILKNFESNASISTVGLRMAQIRALASLGDLDGVTNVVADIVMDSEFKSSENQDAFMKVLFQLITQGRHDALERLKPFYRKVAEDGALQLSSTNGRLLLALIRQSLSQGKWETAAVLDSIFGKTFAFNRVTEFRDGLVNSIERNVDTADLVKRLAVVESLGHIKRPLLWAMNETLRDNNQLKFEELYNTLYASDDFKAIISERPHVAYPMVAKLINEMNSMTSVAEKLPKYNQLCDLLYVKSDATDFEYANDYLFRAVEKDWNAVGDILSHARREHRNCIATAIVEKTMKSKTHNLQHLLELMEGPLNPDGNVRVMSARVGQELVRLLTSNDVTPTTLKLASKIVAATFVFGENSPQRVHDGYGFKVVSKIMLSPKLADNRISELVDIWTEESRISLNAEEVSSLENSLSENNMPHRAGLVKQLRRKSKTVVRWMETEDISLLEEEARSLSDPEKKINPGVLARLYSIIISKRATETPRNLLSIAKNAQQMLNLSQSSEIPRTRLFRILSASFEEALKDLRSDISDEFWKLPVNYAGAYGFLYALNLCCRGKAESAKEVLEKVKLKHDKSVVTGALNRICDAAVEVEEDHLKQFVNLLTETFAIPITQRKRLLQLAKNNSLKQLIDEKKLKEAFDLVRSESEAHKQMFGQYPMIHACIEAENQVLMKDVFNLIVKLHDRNTAAIDFVLTFLEAGLDSSAKRMFEKHVTYLTGLKLNYIVIREARLGRPDVLHKLFELVDIDDTKATSVDLQAHLVPKLISMYDAQKNLEDLRKLQAEVKRVSFPLDPKLKSTLESVIQNLEKKEQKMSLSQSATSIDS
ncbi:hypothetical protein QR680_005110 [Steinernema hermaphroditum]|uniref:Pentacotripeptide-repeat region of PRORP domain-containing protein n=1 Tax=Steinernema hermaphroditum TaxID=289476 RepID=A0AA39HRY3_9BILA|nr:hypothetical protein QR680_005110 [Steinernema hermaphroditum]